MVMPSNTTGIRVGYLCAKYEDAPCRLGHLFSPGGQTGPHPFMPYALDNGAFGCFNRKVPFDDRAYLQLLAWAYKSKQAPLWALVPDVVGDREKTLAMWNFWSGIVLFYGWPLAFAAQDGMTPADVPDGASVVFRGGSTEWKWSTVHIWAAAFPGRLHVGRVNGLPRLRQCAALGVTSCDGTGYSRTTRQMDELALFLAEQASPLSLEGSSAKMAHG